MVAVDTFEGNHQTVRGPSSTNRLFAYQVGGNQEERTLRRFARGENANEKVGDPFGRPSPRAP